MASKPINPQPLQMPTLSQLPDPMKDLMGGTGFSNPTSMMMARPQEINDLFAPKPLSVPLIKPSPEAAKALQTAQNQIKEQSDEYARLQEQQLRYAEQQRREAEQQSQEYLKMAAQLKKQREKALKEKAESQGGKLGAAEDGSFLLDKYAHSLITSDNWLNTISDLKLTDQMNNWLIEAEKDLRTKGIADDVIKAELENARSIITANIRKHTADMRSDKTDLADVGLAVVKGLAPLSNLAGVVASSLGFDSAAGTLHQFGTDLSNAMSEGQSKTMQLDRANNDYLNEKQAALNPNRGWFERAGDTLANIHKSGNKFSTAVDLVGIALPALFTGGITTGASQVGGRAAVSLAGRFAQGGVINRGLTFAGNQISKHGAATATVLAYGGGDAAQSAYDGVMNSSYDNLKAGYIRAYGEQDWNALVKSHNGDKSAIKQEVANNAAEKAVAAFAPMAILSAPLGLEGMVARTVAGKSNAVAGSKLLSIGAAGISEGLEEGFTTFAGNYGQHGGGTLGAGTSLTGVALDTGVPEAAAIGAIAGVGMSAPITLVDNTNRPQRENYSVRNVDINDYVRDGNLNQDLFEREVLQSFYAEKRSALEQGMSEPQANAYLQLLYNQYIDNADTWEAMQPAAQKTFKKKLATEFDISSNRYADYKDTTVATAYASGDIEQVKATGDEHALNAFRMAHGVETDLVPTDGRTYYQALANVMNHLQSADKNVTTKERHAQYVQYTNDDTSAFKPFKDQLSRDDLTSLDQYVMTVLDAGQRRLTDTQQQQANLGTPDDTNQQTVQSQPTGQSSTTPTDGTVASQSPTTGRQTDQTNPSQVGTDRPTGTGTNPTQSGGDGTTRQGINPTTQADPTTERSAEPVGNPNRAEQTPQTGDTLTTPATTNAGGQTASEGNTGQTDQSREPTGATNTSATEIPASDRSTGATQTERRTDGGSDQVITKASIEKNLFKSGANPSRADVELVVDGLRGVTKRPLAYAELQPLATPTDTELADYYDVALGLMKLSQAQFNQRVAGGIYGYKSMKSGHGLNTRKTYETLIKSYAQLLYDRQMAKRRAEKDQQHQALNAEKAEQRAIEQARVQQERAELKAVNERIRAEKRSRLEAQKQQKKIDDLDVTYNKAQQELFKREKERQERTQQYQALETTQQELTQQLAQAKDASKSAKEQVAKYTRQLKQTNTAIDKAYKAWHTELKKETRAELKAQWQTEKKALATIKDSLTKATKEQTLADKEVANLTKQLGGLTLKLKKAKQQVTSTERAARQSRSATDVLAAKLNALRGVGTESTQPIDSAETPATTDNLPAVIAPTQRNRRLRLETTSTGRPTILMGMTSTGLPPIELGFTSSLGLDTDQHVLEVQRDLLSDIPATADIVSIVRELAEIVGVPYDVMLDTLISNGDNLSQSEYDGLTNLLETILIDLHEQTNEQPDTQTTVTDGTETASQTQRTEPPATQQAQGDTQTATSKPQVTTSQQEQTNEQKQHLENSPQTTTGRTTDGREKAIVGDNTQPDGQQRAVSPASEPTVSEEPSGDGTTTNETTNQLGVTTKGEPSNQPVADEITQAVELEGLLDEYQLIDDYHRSLPEAEQESTTEDFIAKLSYALALEQSQAWQQAEQTAQDELADQQAQGVTNNAFGQSGSADLDFLLALPKAVYQAVKTIWNAIKKNVAAVSMALAITTGTTFAIPTEAVASTPVETAVVQNIVKQNDNNGKPFIVADKQAGTLTLYTPQGQQLTSTPALFGKAIGDSITTKNTTPSGRYDLQYVDGKRIEGKGYGGSAQALSVNGKLQKNNAGNIAIHRVLPIENRKARLDSKDLKDNRISHGCINVPSSFYDAHLNHKQDTVIYVLPETDTARTGIFTTPEPKAETKVETKAETKAETTTDTPAANVSKQMDNANKQSVEVTSEQLTQAVPYTQIQTQPVASATPATIAGTTPSGQVAITTPSVVGGVSITEVNVPTKFATPAELQANGVFDTAPIASSVRTSDGLSVYDVVIGLLGALGAGAAVRGNRKKKLASKQQAGEAVPEPTVSSLSTDQRTAQRTIDTHHNQPAHQNDRQHNTPHVETHVQAPVQNTPLASAVSRQMWINYLNTQSHTTQFEKGGQATYLDDLTSNLNLLAIVYDMAMSDPTYEQIKNGTLADGRGWKFTDITNGKRSGLSATITNVFAGATQAFDNLMHANGIARGGHEADSSLPSIHLAQVRSKSSGAYAQIYKLFIKPLFKRIDNLAVELRTSTTKLEHDIGRVATLRHILNEGATALWRSKARLIAERQAQLSAVQAELAKTEQDKGYSRKLVAAEEQLTQEISRLQSELDKSRAMYYGREVWDGTTKLPGGYTKAQAERQLAEIKAKYADNFTKVETLAKETAKTTLNIRQFATAGGVFDNADLAVFRETGFKEYVPLYKEQTDPRLLDETDNITQTSIIDRALADIPTQQAKSLGLTKDLSRYAREGATEPAADAITNLKIFSVNMAGRIGQQQWLQTVQQLYEGTVGKTYTETTELSQETLTELNESADSGKLQGLIRVRPGMEDFLPRNLRSSIKLGDVKPIIAKGFNQHGELVTYHYYFTEPTIQNEVYRATDLVDNLTNKALRNVSAITRTAARFMTVFKPVWVAYNFVRDSFERISIMLMRPVKDRNGNLVDRWELSKAFFRNLVRISSSLSLQREIYQYLVQGEVKTPLQQVLHQAVGSGAINLTTSQTEKHSVIADLKKSNVEVLAGSITKLLGDGMNQLGIGKLKQLAEQKLDTYVLRITEVPQVTTALASYLAYKDVGVNQTETANRVRDAYDPLRSNNKYITNTSTLYPFVRSALSGNYNLIRSLTEYWGVGERGFTTLYALGATFGTMALLAAMSGLMGDDENGVPKIARLPTSTLMSGIPVPIGDDGVWTAPVGFGMNKLFLGVGANLFRQWNGWQTGTETLQNLLGVVMDNTSPIQMASSKAYDTNPIAAASLSLVPTVLVPLAELGFNVNSYHGSKIINRETPKDQYDHLQDNFNTPNDYKKMVTWLFNNSGGAIDMRPETLKYLFDGYGNMTGPFAAIPKSVLQDKDEKTLGNAKAKGEYFSPLMVAIGADMSIQPNALDVTTHAYALQDLRYKLHKQYGVGATHSKDDYDETASIGKRGGKHNLQAWELTKLKLEQKNAPQEVTDYIINGMQYDKERKLLDKAFKELATDYYQAKVDGTATDDMYRAVQSAWDNLENLTNQYVKENNRAYYKLLQQTP